MPSSCPICEQPIASTAGHCAVCGFPTGLAIEGLRSIDSLSAAAEPDAGGTALASLATARPPRPVPAPSPEHELTQTISRDLLGKMELMLELGRGPDVTSELCQAALIEAEGRVAEALDILRSAQSRLDSETEQVLDQRARLANERRRALQATGVRFALGSDFDRLNAALAAGDRSEAIARLADAERRVGQFESDWKGLQGLIAQIEGLRNQAAELHFPLGEISSELEGLQERLQSAEVTEDALDTFAQEAAQVLMLLHEAIPSSLEEELRRSGLTLDRFPDDHPPASLARRLHLEAGRHLKKGRLSDAIQSVRELRREIEDLERAPRPLPPEPPVAPGALSRVAGAALRPAAPLESEDEMLDRLLKKARSLAGRVRTLPSDSEAAHEAAVQIRQATELLRSRRLTEADQTLTDLMRTLAGGALSARE